MYLKFPRFQARAFVKIEVRNRQVTKYKATVNIKPKIERINVMNKKREYARMSLIRI